MHKPFGVSYGKMYPTPLVRPKKARKSRRKPIIVSFLFLIIASSYATITLARPFAELKPSVTQSNFTVSTPASKLPWPGYGQGALGLTNGKIVSSYGEQKQVPIASVAKVITALVILDKHPLKAGESGPTIVMTQQDVDSYRRYVSINGSVMGVYAGQRLTERQMLQGIMLPSANNIADSLAIWAFGSVDNYLVYANQYLQRNGLTNTKVGGDASGYLSDSVSTTKDLVKLGAIAMNNPALAEIVGQKSAVIPGTGTVTNYNSLLGGNNVVGVKTGNNDDNLGVFLGAAKININGKSTTVISALSGAPNLNRVLRDSGTLLGSVPANFATTTVVKKDAVLATYREADGDLVQAVAAQDINVFSLRGDSIKASVTVNPISYNAKAGQRVGTVKVDGNDFAAAQTAAIVLKEQPVKPDIPYRLTHP